MQQLPLDLYQPAPPTVGNFEAGANAECVACVASLAAGERTHRFVYLWGPPGAGKTHLLHALAASAGARAASGSPQAGVPAFAPDRDLYLVDDCERLEADAQHRLFTLMNRVNASSARTVVTAGDRPPVAMPVREDLRTRLGWGLVFGLHPLSDDQKAAALQRQAQARGAVLGGDLIPYLLRHYDRDMRSLAALLDSLDRFAYARQRPLTLPLLREYEACRHRHDC